jgi:hypothetical protein
VLADDDSTMATEPPASAAPEPSVSGSTPAPQQQPGDKKDKDKDKEKEKDKDREREREKDKDKDTVTIEVRITSRSRVLHTESRGELTKGDYTGPNTAQIHHHPPSQGRAAAEYPDTSKRHPGTHQERNSFHQPSSKCVCLPYPLSLLPTPSLSPPVI